MTADVLALYQETILDHSRRPRNVGALSEGAERAEGHNPVCGDRITVHVRLAGAVVTEATFECIGCAICMASASMMTEAVRGRTIAEAGVLGRRVHDLVAAAPDAPIDDLGVLRALAGVRRFPLRITCALLPWDTLRAAYEHGGSVSTE